MAKRLQPTAKKLRFYSAEALSWGSPMSTLRNLWTIGLLLVVGKVSAQAPPYTVSSRAQGAPFDLTVTEVEREQDKSYLKVPGFHSRTAPGARWLMCAYTDLAIKRGYSHWAVMYPQDDKDVVVVVFSNSGSSSPKQLFGNEFDKERVIGEDMMPVSKMLGFCGMTR